MTVIERFWRATYLSASVGAVAGAAATAFLYAMNWAWQFQTQHHEVIYLLPLVTAVITFVYQKYPKSYGDASAYVFEEIHEPKEILPVQIAPLIFISTIASHFAGASTGREGTAVQVAT